MKEVGHSRTRQRSVGGSCVEVEQSEGGSYVEHCLC
jgi:hypothetical protein